MKLQKQKVGKHKDKNYYKYVILVPKKYIDELGWYDVNELKPFLVDNFGLILTANKERLL